eukprot:1161334-Pelagomonas_calceolata.AAC.3
MASYLAVCCGTHAYMFPLAKLPMECVMGVTGHIEKVLWLEGRLHNGGVKSKNKIYLAAEKVAYWVRNGNIQFKKGSKIGKLAEWSCLATGGLLLIGQKGINTPIKKSGKLMQPVKLHPTQYGAQGGSQDAQNSLFGPLCHFPSPSSPKSSHEQRLSG